jgi:hypothetical protein
MSVAPEDGAPRNAWSSLRRFARRSAVREYCELCSAELTAEHAHLVELSARRLVCACDACAILFDYQGAGKYRRVPRRVQFLPDFRLSDIAWQGLGLPINLAFFLHSTAAGRVVALYPSPGGATEALPALDVWQTLTEDNPILRDFQPDVEALLVNRLGPAPEHYRVGIDECYKLVGLVRTHWRGLSGGTAVWREIGRFFTELKERAGPPAPTSGSTTHA